MREWTGPISEISARASGPVTASYKLPERGTFFRFQMYESWEGMPRNMSFRSIKYNDVKSFRKILWLWKSSKTFYNFVIYSHLKESTFAAIKRDAKF